MLRDTTEMRELMNASSGRQSDKHKSRFQHLWDEAVSTSAQIAALTSDLDNLVARVESEVVPVERDVGALIRQVLERQLDFSIRKSLRKWQRRELEHRIADLVDDLVEMDLLDAEMHERLALRLAAGRGFQPDPESVLSIAEQLDGFLEPEYAADVDCCWNRPAPDDEHKLTAPVSMDDSVFNRLFRQAAAALHPDRETDIDKLPEKHDLMVQLLKARDERDLITLLGLHERFAVAESGLSNTDESKLEAVLLDHLQVLRVRRESIILQSPRHFTTFRRFYHSNPADREIRIASHIAELRCRKVSLRQFISKIHTLKDLQEYLSQPDPSVHLPPER